mmetsp:Transcript_23378/g.55636  ORF Transcript_23378/g.55636 Transcript_23378/m.55636 type:complete len:231 (-) Transcript_23378:181-873(-)
MGDGAEVHIFELAAHRHAACEPCRPDATGPQCLGQHMGRGLALGGEAGREDDLLDARLAGAHQQLGRADLARADAVQRAQPAQQHEVIAPVGAGALQCGLVRRRLDDAEQPAVALPVRADGADRRLAEGVAALAMLDALARRRQRLGQPGHGQPVVLQQVVGHALGRLLAHAGQALERLDQGVQCIQNEASPSADDRRRRRDLIEQPPRNRLRQTTGCAPLRARRAAPRG